MKKIKLGNRNCFTFVDDGDFDWLKQWKWHLHEGYVCRNIYIKRSGKKHPKFDRIFMHRLILKTPKEFYTDHINKNRLDNRKENLRIATKSQNGMNKFKQKNNTSGYKGVYQHKQSHQWQARIGLNGKSIFLGLFRNIKEAALMYNQAARKYHGKFAQINNI